jgi:hypothetical protein
MMILKPTSINTIPEETTITTLTAPKRHHPRHLFSPPCTCTCTYTVNNHPISHHLHPPLVHSHRPLEVSRLLHPHRHSHSGTRKFAVIFLTGAAPRHRSDPSTISYGLCIFPKTEPHLTALRAYVRACGHAGILTSATQSRFRGGNIYSHTVLIIHIRHVRHMRVFGAVVHPTNVFQHQAFHSLTRTCSTHARC